MMRVSTAATKSPTFRVDFGRSVAVRHLPTQPARAREIDDGYEYVSGPRRVVYIVCAMSCLVLGLIGVVVPGLPTTPFLLLTSWLLARSWPRAHQLLLANRFVGPMIQNWHRHRAITLRAKLQAYALVGVAMLLLVAFSKLTMLPLLAVLCLVSAGLVVIHRLPTLPVTEA